MGVGIAAGSAFGLALLPVILLANLAAIFLQRLALRLGIATGRDLAQMCRERFSRRTAIALWLACEVAIVACDLAELLGTAIALKLLFGIPLAAGVAITAFDTLLILALQRYGFRLIEAVVAVLVATVAACLFYDLWLARPDPGLIATAFRPDAALLANPAALYLAVGIFGATVMPHNLYLHSSVVQTRAFAPTPAGRGEAMRYSTIDLILALTVALAINAAILIVAASAFHSGGTGAVASIEDAHRLLSPALGTAVAGTLFAVALLAAGQSSTLTGTMAGQIVMEGFLHLRLPPFARRLLTRVLALGPAMAVTLVAGAEGANQLLVLSQVILSLQLGFAVVPLLMFTGDARLMGAFVNGRAVAWAGGLLAGGIVLANGWLVARTVGGWLGP